MVAGTICRAAVISPNNQEIVVSKKSTDQDAGLIPCQACVLISIIQLLLRFWLKKRASRGVPARYADQEVQAIYDELIETELPLAADFPHAELLALLQDEKKAGRWRAKFKRRK